VRKLCIPHLIPHLLCLVLSACIGMANVAVAQIFKTIVVLAADEQQPCCQFIQATNGKFYGTSVGFYSTAADEAGIIFSLTTTGKLATLYSFCSQAQCSDGVGPQGLVQAANGELYGTAFGGGANAYGTIFEVTLGGKLTTLYSFCSQENCADGEYPVGALVQATNGNFYGAALEGGSNGDGTIFEVTPAGKLTTIHNFCSQANCADGYFPTQILQVSNGDFYGTTNAGGAGGQGTIFKMTAAGKLTTLHSFCSQPSCADGAVPKALIQASNGNLYGSALFAGANGQYADYGTIFEITLAGKLTTLYSFCSLPNCADGSVPRSLVQASSGNFYGVTSTGGADGFGTIFEITPAGELTTLHSFDSTDGNGASVLIQGTNGTFYGATDYGATNNFGTLFSLGVGLGPFVETTPSFGKVGSPVTILGNSLKGTMSVAFNGTAATFKVVSASEISTTVPVGATTGTVQVTTPSGTLKGNTKFRVTP
jgi:uncharacterized repeat protein (TIGR03803 family)